MFWKDQLKEEEFKRILKEKDFSALQHAKQAVVSRIYQPQHATIPSGHTAIVRPPFQLHILRQR